MFIKKNGYHPLDAERKSVWLDLFRCETNPRIPAECFLEDRCQVSPFQQLIADTRAPIHWKENLTIRPILLHYFFFENFFLNLVESILIWIGFTLNSVNCRHPSTNRLFGKSYNQTNSFTKRTFFWIYIFLWIYIIIFLATIYSRWILFIFLTKKKFLYFFLFPTKSRIHPLQ